MNVKIAFASNDRQSVNQHFGAAEAFAIHELDAQGARLMEVVEFSERDVVMDGHEGKLAAKIALLTDCAAVYCNAVGASAIQQLLARGIQPMRVDEGTPIISILAQLQHSLRTEPPLWLAKKLRPQPHFAEDETWQE